MAHMNGLRGQLGVEMREIEDEIRKLKQPTDSSDLFLFELDIRRLLSRREKTNWLLDPDISKYSKARVRASKICASIVKECVPNNVVSVPGNPVYTHELLELLRRLTPSPYAYSAQPAKPSDVFPQRSIDESLSAYLRRLELWVERYLPEARSFQPVLQRVAGLAWISHCKLYNLQNLSPVFERQLSEFKTLTEVFNWFLRQDATWGPPINTSSQLPASQRSPNNVNYNNDNKNNTNRHATSNANAPQHSPAAQAGRKRFFARSRSQSKQAESQMNADMSQSIARGTATPFSSSSCSSSVSPSASPSATPSATPSSSPTFIYPRSESSSEEEEVPANRGAVTTMALEIKAGSDPKSYQEAMESPEAMLWKQACNVEMDTMRNRKAFDLVDAPKRARILSNHWVFERELSNSGASLEYKASLYVRGFTQRPGKDYEETFAETVSIEMVRLVLALVIQRDWHIEQLDIKSAFLYGDLEHKLYMRQPPGYGDGTKRVCRLKKSLCGLKQAPRQWFIKLSTILNGFGFKKVPNVRGVFMSAQNRKKTIILVYVDDILVASSDSAEALRVNSLLKGAFEIVSAKFPESYLALNIKKTATGITLDAGKNVNKLLDDFRDSFSSYRFTETVPILPSEVGQAARISKMQKGLLQPDPRLAQYAKPLPKADASRYRSAVGSLNDLVSKCRPDIAFASSQLSIYHESPNDLNWRMLMRLLRYLESSKEARLTFSKQRYPELIGFSDANFRGEHGGFAWSYGNCLIYWTSRHQRRVCVNAHEAGMRSLISAAEYGASIRNVLVALGELNPDAAIPLYTKLQLPHKVNVGNDKAAANRMREHSDNFRGFANQANLKAKYCDPATNLANVLATPLNDAAFDAVVRQIMLIMPDGDMEYMSDTESDEFSDYWF